MLHSLASISSSTSLLELVSTLGVSQGAACSQLLVQPEATLHVCCRLRQAVLDLAMACLHVAFLLWLLWHLAPVLKSWGEAGSWKEVCKPAAGLLVDATVCVLQALGEYATSTTVVCFACAAIC